MTIAEIEDLISKHGSITAQPLMDLVVTVVLEAVEAEREACASILDQNVAVCGTNSAMRDVLAGNALAIRARGDV